MNGVINRRLVSSLNLPDEMLWKIRKYLVSYEGGRILPSADAIQFAAWTVSRGIGFESSLWEVEWRITFVRYMWKYFEVDDPVVKLFDEKTFRVVKSHIQRCQNRTQVYPQDKSLRFFGQHYRMVYISGKWKIKKNIDWSDSDNRRNGRLPSWVIRETGWQWPILHDEV